MLTINHKQRSHKSLPKLLAYSLVLGLFLIFFGFLCIGKAHAETNTPIAATAPTPNSGTTGGGADFTPLTGVGRGSFNGQVMWYKVYVRNGQATTITVNQTCTDSFGNPTVDYSMENLSDQEQDYGSGNQGNIWVSSVKPSSDCTKNITFDIKSTYGIASAVPGHTDYHVFGFYAQIEPGPGSAEQYFTVTSSNSSNANSYIGMATPDITNPSLGGKLLKYSTIYRPTGTWGASVMFAPRCDQGFSDPVSIQIFDPDNGVYQDNMHAYLERSDVVPYMDTGAINWSTQKTWTAQEVQGGPFGQSNTTATLSFNASNNYIYKFHIVGAAHPNTIQIKVPFDQFDAKRTARQGCLPAVTCTAVASPASVLPGGQSTITITGTSSTGQWPSSYYIRRSSPGAVKDITSPGDNSGQDIVTPPATTVYKYFIASSRPHFTTNGLAGGPAINSTPCQTPVNVGAQPSASCTPSSASVEVGVSSQFSFIFTIVNPTSSSITVNFAGSAAGGVTIQNGPNPPSSSVGHTGAGGQPVTVTFTATANYDGSLTATVSYNGAVMATCQKLISALALPYFQVWNSDVSAGGGFAGSTGDPELNVLGKCGGSSYISPANSSTGGNNAGGIRGFGSPYTLGSRSDFGALAMGLIPSDSTHGIGFWTGLNHTAMFANTGSSFNFAYGSNPPGGFLNGSPQNGYGCVKDYFTDTQAGAQAYSGNLANDIANCPNRCQFIAKSNVTLNSTNIPDGKQVTLYVDGDVTINGNVDLSNPAFNPSNPANIPYFNLIVRGNIILTPSINKLYGAYVAQPIINQSTGAYSKGIFVTCNDGSDAQDTTANTGPCNSQLVVNGAVIAQHVELLRNHGTLHGTCPTGSGISGCPAEIFNFVPSLVIGNPALASQPGTINGIFSLSPVF
jgi:hypothetical protein